MQRNVCERAAQVHAMYAGKRRGVAWTLLHLPLFGAVSWISVALAALIDEEVGRHVKYKALGLACLRRQQTWALLLGGRGPVCRPSGSRHPLEPPWAARCFQHRSGGGTPTARTPTARAPARAATRRPRTSTGSTTSTPSASAARSSRTSSASRQCRRPAPPAYLDPICPCIRALLPYLRAICPCPHAICPCCYALCP